MGESTTSNIIEKPISEVKIGDYVMNKDMTDQAIKFCFLRLMPLEYVREDEELVWSLI